MRFAENGRISHRQLYRQMILALLAPFLLCLPGGWQIRGINGILGTLAAVGVLVFYVVFLIRVAPCYGDLLKTAGGFMGRVIGVFFLVFVVLSGAYLLALLEEIVTVSLVAGVPGRWISLVAVLACGMGASHGMQRRGRLAEVSGGVLLWGIVIMMIVCIGQSKVSYLQEMVMESAVTGAGFWKACYGVICAFAAVGLLPFMLGDVEKQGSAGQTVIFGVLTLGGILVGMELLLPAVFGYGRLGAEKYPVIPLLAGADLPGNVLARFDVIWMGFLIYSLLFSIGSLFHYGHLIIGKAKLGSGRFWMAAVVYLVSIWEPLGMGIEAYFGNYLAYVFVPGMLAVQVFLFWKGKWRKRAVLSGRDHSHGTSEEEMLVESRGLRRGVIVASALLTLCWFLGGCSATVEPEKRLYPLALGVDAASDGFVLTYGMPDMNQATGQDKGGESGNSLALAYQGADFGEIEAAYNRSQEKFLDMGHLEVLILGKNILVDNRWKPFLDYLENKPFVGEDVYVFRAESAGEVLNWKGEQNSTVGEYLTGMMENRMTGQKIQGVTLREVLHEKYKTGGLPALPIVRVAENALEIVWEE